MSQRNKYEARDMVNKRIILHLTRCFLERSIDVFLISQYLDSLEASILVSKIIFWSGEFSIISVRFISSNRQYLVKRNSETVEKSTHVLFTILNFDKQPFRQRRISIRLERKEMKVQTVNYVFKGDKRKSD